MTVTSIRFVDGTQAVLDHEVAFAWAIIASPASPELVYYSEQASIGGMNELALALKNYRARISTLLPGSGIDRDPQTQLILRTEFPGKYRSAISASGHVVIEIDFTNGEDSEPCFVSGQIALDSMRSFLDSKIESLIDAIKQAKEEAKSEFRSAPLMKWRVEEWLASEKEARSYDLSAHPDVALGSVLSAVPTTTVRN